MSQNKTVDVDKISLASNAKGGLIIFLLFIWVLTQTFIWVIFNSLYLLPGTILFLFSLLFLFKSICVSIGMNKSYILMNTFSKKSRAIFEGFHFKLPWENIQYKIDLEVVIHSDITETFPTQDGSMQVTASIMSKPDSEAVNEKSRSKQMLTYVKFEVPAIKGMQDAVAKKSMRERFANLPSEEVQKSKSDVLLNKGDFADLEETLSIKVIKCAIKDVDYNEETQRARNAVMKAESLGDMKKALVKSGYSEAEAKAIAPLLDKDINLKKQINDVNFNGLSMPPELIKAISLIVKKFGGE